MVDVLLYISFLEGSFACQLLCLYFSESRLEDDAHLPFFGGRVETTI